MYHTFQQILIQLRMGVLSKLLEIEKKTHEICDKWNWRKEEGSRKLQSNLDPILCRSRWDHIWHQISIITSIKG